MEKQVPIRPPGPKGGLIFNALATFRRDPLHNLLAWKKEFGEVVFFKLFSQPAYLISNPNDIEEVLVTQNRKFIKNKALRESRLLLGNGLLTSDGEFWRRQRRLAQPAFHRAKIENYGEIMVNYTQEAISSWKDGQKYDIHKEMMELTLRVVARTLFNADVTGISEGVGQAMQVVMDQFIARANTGFLIPTRVPTPGNLRMQRAVHQLDKIIYRIIAERHQSLAAGEPDPGDLLSMLMQARDQEITHTEFGDSMTDKQLRDEVMTLFLAGHETTAILLSWIWYLLTQNPEVEEKLLKELKSNLGNRPPTVSDLPALQYTSWIVNEGLRMYPPAWSIGRQAVEEVEIGGYNLPSGSLVLMSQWVNHHDEQYFPEPFRFLPERWENDLERKIPRYAFFPFGGGPRQCIGNNFALMEAKLILATIAQKVHFDLLPGFQPVAMPSITLRPKTGIKVELHCREI